MKRDILKTLLDWQKDKNRKPIILRGARQVGKSWIIRYFGEHYFKNYIEINLELQYTLKSCFTSLDPLNIIKTIELSLNVNIIPGKTLLFIDEIQESPQAVKALRYFYEKIPDLHVIGAGSLLEFIQESENISIPVGRIQNLYMKPLSFGEFLSAASEEKLRIYLKSLQYNNIIPESIEKKCEELLNTYLFTGGMPQAVKERLDSGNFHKTNEILLTILQNYRQDFGKYGKKVNHEYLEAVFTKTPGIVGDKFKYSKINAEVHSREIKKALNLLIKAQVLTRVNSTSGSGIPMVSHQKESLFKILFLDVGLMQSAMGVNSEIYLSKDLMGIYSGAIAEQYIGQQLMSLLEFYKEPELFFWQREKKGSESELDYLYQYGTSILPVEVKRGKTGTLRSLHIFMQEKESLLGIRFSMHPLSYTNNILSIPLYAVEALPNLICQILD